MLRLGQSHCWSQQCYSCTNTLPANLSPEYKLMTSPSISNDAVAALHLPSCLIKVSLIGSLPFTWLMMAQDIASMAFSPDGRLLVAQGGAPEWNLVLWVWEKSKVVTSVKTTNAAGNPVYQVSLEMHMLDY